MATQPPLPPANGDGDSIVDRDVWLACAIPFSRLPTVGAEVYYFPDGHAEQHRQSAAPHRFPCTVTDVSLGADDKTDEVFAKISLRPGSGPAAASPPGPGSSNSPPQERLSYFTKKLSQTDTFTNFFIPLEAKHTIPELDSDDADPRVQDLVMRDTRGKSWTFVKPRKQHLLTKGWAKFAKAKMLVAGDTIVFMRRPNGDLIVGLRRVPRVRIVFQDPVQPAQDVMEAVRLAAAGRPFTVTYFPRQDAVEFIVPRSDVDGALATSWEPGAQVRLQIMEDENKKRTEWVHGRVKAIRQNIWRMLEIDWNVAPFHPLAVSMRFVNAWQVEFPPPPPTSTGRMIGSESQAQGPSSSTTVNAWQVAFPPPPTLTGRVIGSESQAQGPSSSTTVNAWQVAFPPPTLTGRVIGSESQALGPSSSTVMQGASSRHTGGPSAAPSATHTGGPSAAPSATPPRTISTPSASPPNDPVSLPPLQNVKSIKLFGETIPVDGGGSEQVNQAPPPNGGGDAMENVKSIKLFGETISVEGGGSEQVNRAPPPPNGGGDATDDDGSVEKKDV